MTEMVDHPQHYKSADGSEVIDVIKTATFDLNGIESFDTGNMIKYICRWKWKNGIEDVKKCRWYARHLVGNRSLFTRSGMRRSVDPKYMEFTRYTTNSFTADLSGDEYSFTHLILSSALLWWHDSSKYLPIIIQACDDLIEYLKKEERKIN